MSLLSGIWDAREGGILTKKGGGPTFVKPKGGNGGGGGGGGGGAGTGFFSIGTPATVLDNTAYNAWPNAIKLANGSYLMIYTAGTTHHGDLTGVALAVTGSWNGSTIVWNTGSPITVDDDASLWTTGAALAQVSSGRVFASIWTDSGSASTDARAYLRYSDDNGATWSARVALHTASGFTQASYATGPVSELSNGQLMVNVEGYETAQTFVNTTTKVLFSSDQGASWSGPVVVGSWATDNRMYVEACARPLSGSNLLMLLRTSDAIGGGIFKSTSSDNGATWTAPTGIIVGHSFPCWTKLTTGTLVVAVRKNSTNGLIGYASRDNGNTWKPYFSIDETMFESEYASIVDIPGNKAMVVYGYQPTSALTNSDLKQVIITDGISGSPESVNFANVQLLINAETQGATSSDFIDASTFARTITRNSANITRDAPSACFGRWGILALSAVSRNDFTVGSASDWTFLHDGTSSWTLDMYLDFSGFASTQVLFDTAGGTTVNSGIYMEVNTSRVCTLQIYRADGSPTYTLNGTFTALSNNTDIRHLRLAVDLSLGSANAQLWENGVSRGTINKTGNAPSVAAPAFPLRFFGVGAAGTSWFRGTADDIRLVKGQFLGSEDSGSAFPTS